MVSIIICETWGIVKYAVFLRKIGYNFENNGYAADLIFNNLNQKPPKKFTNKVGKTLRAAQPLLRYTQRLRVETEQLLESMREPGYRTIDFK